MYILLRIIFTAAEFFGMLLLSLSTFRIYFRYSLHKVALIAVVMASTSVYIRDTLDLVSYSLLPVITTEVILITVLFGLPLIFSFLISIIGMLATAMFETLVLAIGSYFHLFTQDTMKTSLTQFIVHELINTATLLLVTYPIQKYKLGFHTTSNDALKAYNFWLAAILVIAIFGIQISIVSFRGSTVHILLPIALCGILLIGVYLAYQHNRKLWKNRRERLSKR
ncbi:hypothetical protein [Paenibacillus xerothermodurans]|uniref:Uncharacterized protein n=1 Tax=Paenibacillus xerothermodurans TaxID=1977292 RepID=A0A2W1NTA3_PAEXE|nr:hypothetical protein [Paenibacillus xerothermodurans]PZE21006.1 hypothetical protein CBW46_009995 [Paenibacillus xerothermodurans]